MGSTTTTYNFNAIIFDTENLQSFSEESKYTINGKTYQFYPQLTDNILGQFLEFYP